jgi:hypothetical protein
LRLGGRRVRIDDMMKIKTLDVVVELLIGTFGEHSVKSKGYLLRRKIFWIQSRRKEKNLSIRVVLYLKPERLDTFLLKINTEYGPAFLQFWYYGGYADVVLGNCLGMISQILIVKGTWFIERGSASPYNHHETHNNDYIYKTPSLDHSRLSDVGAWKAFYSVAGVFGSLHS